MCVSSDHLQVSVPTRIGIAVAVGMSTLLAQAPREVPADMIRMLTTPNALESLGISSGCGNYSQRRETAESLVRLGDVALPDIERALESVEREGDASPFRMGSKWILQAYSRLVGPSAVPRLVRMLGSPQCSSFGRDIEEGIAVALGLSSYVVASTRPVQRLECDRIADPSDGLDRAIRAWVHKDRAELVASLGPAGGDSLKGWIARAGWRGLLRDWWPTTGEVWGVGYRFAVRPPPAADVDPTIPRYCSGSADSLDCEVICVDHQGRECGEVRVTFQRSSSRASGATAEFRVNNGDISELLRAVAACASRP